MDDAPLASTAERPLAELGGVTHRYGERTALEDFGFAIRPGEVFGLLGPNGAGKTTAVRILCGLLEPTRGSARIAGHDVAAEPLEARRHLAFVPDGAPLYANLSARAHLRLVGRLHGLEEDAIERGATRLLRGLGLLERADDPVGQHSHGMRQKTAIACALLTEPDLLVLDEPLSGLDAPTAAVVKQLMRAWADAGRAVLLTSHLLDVVERVCDRMAIVGAGRLLAVGTLAELRTRSGRDGSLEEVFGALTEAEDPARVARELLS